MIEGGLKIGSTLVATATMASASMNAQGICTAVRVRALGFVSLHRVLMFIEPERTKSQVPLHIL